MKYIQSSSVDKKEKTCYIEGFVVTSVNIFKFCRHALQVVFVSEWMLFWAVKHTMKPHFTDTRQKWTPPYYGGQLYLSL